MQAEETEVPGMPSAPFFKFQKFGDKVKGKIIGKRKTPARGAFKEQDVVDLMTTEGEYSVGCTADLAFKLKDLEPGQLISIEYTSKKPVAGKPSPMKVFTVKLIKAKS